MTILTFSSGATSYKLEELTSQIKDNTYKQMTSVVVSQNSQVLYEQYFNGADENTQHDMRSASKSLTSLAIGLAMDQGLLKGVDEPILNYYKDKMPLKNPDERNRAL